MHRAASYIESPPWESAHPWIIAEIGVNHNGNVKFAKNLITLAASAGANAVKLQVFSAESVASKGAASAAYQSIATGSQDQLSLLRELELSPQDIETTRTHAEREGIAWFATAFDEESTSLIERLDPVAHKIPSGEITNLEMISSRAALGRPLIISTGMATLSETQAAVEAADQAKYLAILHCVSSYPAPLDAAHLSVLPVLQREFRHSVGWSDHTTSNLSSIVAVGIGAKIIERHLTLDQAMRGPDHASSLAPAQFAKYISDLRDAATCLGEPIKRPQLCEIENRHLVRRSWHATRQLNAGMTLLRDDIVSLRPAVGVPVDQDIVGRLLRNDIPDGNPITSQDIDE